MPAQITCNCGISILLINKKTGDKVICSNCGSTITVGAHNHIIESADEKKQHKKEESGFEKVEISQIVDAIHEEKKIAVQKHKRENKLHANVSGKKNTDSSQKRKVPEIVKTGLVSKKIKCLQCGELLELNAKVCFNCGANPRTGKTYVPPPEKKKEKIKIPFSKILLGLFLTGTVIIFFGTVIYLLFKYKLFSG